MARRLLLVEDSAMMRRMIAALLEEEGYDVATANDGLLGFAAAKQAPPELILTDYEMPELDGPGLCGRLKQDAELRPIPVIMLTTLGATESKVIGLNAGADDYLEKPRSPQEVQELFARIRAQLRIADLRGELARRNQQLQSAQDKLHLELELARKVQTALMPRPPKPRGPLRMAVRYHPVNTLGGDVYDFTVLPDGRLGILVADVSGHGVNSALLSGMVKTLAAPLTASGAAPSQVLTGLDEAIGQFFPGEYFCTAFYVVVDEASGTFTYAGVGHPPAVVVGPGGTRLLDSDSGLLGIGMVDEVTDRDDTLTPGESLLVYTDGLPDAMDPKHTLFGTERLSAVLEAHVKAAPAEMLDAMEQAVARHVAPGHAADDINLVLLQNPLA